MFSKLEPYLRKVILNDLEDDLIGSSEWVPLRVKNATEREWLWALLLSEEAGKAFRCLQSGKRHARIGMGDFGSILVPDVPPRIQRRAVEAMRPHWERLEWLRREAEQTRAALTDELARSLKRRRAGHTDA